ncbi:hypothetical protein F5Y10DRAFT_239266 [Nemania abortiva]|nr:hypothetical protein F5Y10DRAFT_239266 [Nemania abortiva]
MGRTEPTVVKPPAAFRRDARAKRARATINKVIPTLLSAHPRARRGIERSELIVDPPPAHHHETERDRGKKKVAEQHAASADGEKEGARRRISRRQRKDDVRDEQPQPGNEKTSAQSAKARRDTLETNEEHGRPENTQVHGPRIRLSVADTLTAAHSLVHLEALPAGDSRSPAQQKQQCVSKGHSSGSMVDAIRPAGKVGILNMASPLSPGGGFFNGATSQEESLCMRTTLLPALRDEFYRLPELGVVYTPDVLVFRSPSSPSSQSRQSTANETEAGIASGSGIGSGGSLPDENDVLPKTDRWFVDVASAAMLRLPETEDGHYADAADRELAVRKMRAVLRVFAARGCSRIVLGAWGCGAYGNPVSEIAGAWRRVLCPGLVRGAGVEEASKSAGASANNPTVVRSEERDGGRSKDKKKSRGRENKENWGAFIDEVVFAIKDDSMAAAFSRAFGEDLLPFPTPLSGHGECGGSVSPTIGDGDDDPVEAARIGELRDKIAQLEIQVEQARSPQFKVGLETVLTKLRKQLPSDDGEVSSSSEREQSSETDDGEDEYDEGC